MYSIERMRDMYSLNHLLCEARLTIPQAPYTSNHNQRRFLNCGLGRRQLLILSSSVQQDSLLKLAGRLPQTWKTALLLTRARARPMPRHVLSTVEPRMRRADDSSSLLHQRGGQRMKTVGVTITISRHCCRENPKWLAVRLN